MSPGLIFFVIFCKYSTSTLKANFRYLCYIFCLRPKGCSISAIEPQYIHFQHSLVWAGNSLGHESLGPLCRAQVHSNHLITFHSLILSLIPHFSHFFPSLQPWISCSGLHFKSFPGNHRVAGREPQTYKDCPLIAPLPPHRGGKRRNVTHLHLQEGLFWGLGVMASFVSSWGLQSL